MPLVNLQRLRVQPDFNLPPRSDRYTKPDFIIYPNQNFVLGTGRNTFQVSLPFAAKTVIMLNNTSNPFFLTVGSRRIPSVNDTQWVCPPSAAGVPGQLQIPVGLVSEFAGFLPLAPALTDLTQVVTVSFQG